MEKQSDVVYMGRVAVDLYSQQIGMRLEDMSNFAKCLGGSSNGMAYDTARQGLRSSMLARAGDEHMGRFLHEELNQAGCDTSYLITDKDRLTALVLLGIKDRDTLPLIFYRDNCADMVTTANDADKQYIASARCLAIIGTCLSHPQTREAVLTALVYARRHGVRTAPDIDYRLVPWELTSLDDGETRFTAVDQVTCQLQKALHLFDAVVDTEEEFHITGSSTDTLQALPQVHGMSHVTLVCKRGVPGCSVYTGATPARLDDGLTATGVRVEVLNVLGTGDTFVSGLLCGYLNDEEWERACRHANACGALVVSRHSCAPAMPSRIELDDYLPRVAKVPHPDLDPHLDHLHRVTAHRRTWPELCVMAFDHHNRLEEMASQCGAPLKRIPALEQLILQVSREVASSTGLKSKAGLLCDDAFGQDALDATTGEGWWIGRPIELPGPRPLEMEHGSIGSQPISWPWEHVVKCLVSFHPEGVHALRLEREQKIAEVYRVCCQLGHELPLEVILPAGTPCSDKLYLRAISRLCDLGVYPDWWKFPPLASAGWTTLSDIIGRCDPHCRDVVILGLDASAE